MTAYDMVLRLKKTKYSELLAYGHAAGWIVKVGSGAGTASAFGLPEADPVDDDVVDVQVSHPLTDVMFLVRFRAERIGGHWGVYTTDKVRRLAYPDAADVPKSGCSPSAVLIYMGANSMGGPR